APSSSSRGPPPTASSTPCWPPWPCPAEPDVLPVPTRRLAVVAALGALAVVAADSVVAFWVVNGLLVAVAVLDWSLTPAAGRVEVRRDVSEAVPLGGRATLTWRVRNPTERAVSVVVADELAPSLRPTRRRFEARVPA